MTDNTKFLLTLTVTVVVAIIGGMFLLGNTLFQTYLTNTNQPPNTPIPGNKIPFDDSQSNNKPVKVQPSETVYQTNNRTESNNTVVKTSPAPTVINTSPLKSINGIWDFKYNLYRTENSKGEISDRTGSLTASMLLQESNEKITWELISEHWNGNEHICRKKTIAGNISGNDISWDVYSKDCNCEGDKSTFTGKIDREKGTIVGRLVPVITPPSSCIGAYADVTAYRRDN